MSVRQKECDPALHSESSGNSKLYFQVLVKYEQLFIHRTKLNYFPGKKYFFKLFVKKTDIYRFSYT
jgi:hypothetical protein